MINIILRDIFFEISKVQLEGRGRLDHVGFNWEGLAPFATFFVFQYIRFSFYH